MKTSILVAVLLSFMLSACGGGGSSSGGGVTNPSSSTPSNSTPTSNAGTDQSGRTTTSVSLDGSASTDPDGDVLTYSWIIQTKPDGSTASISNETSVTPSIVLDLDGQYEIELSVSDGSATSTDSVNITAITPSIVVSGNKEIYWQDTTGTDTLFISFTTTKPSFSNLVINGTSYGASSTWTSTSTTKWSKVVSGNAMGTTYGFATLNMSI